MAERAAAWARTQECVRAAIAYGSLAQGTADEQSDLDVILVAEPGRRDELWARRDEFAEFVHDGKVIWSQQPVWQRAFRYRSWSAQTELDLTIDEESAAPWRALTLGFVVLCDKADVAAQLTADLAEFSPTEFDAASFDGGTWAWLSYLAGRLRHGETWIVRYGVMDTLNNRVVPLLGSAGHSATADLGQALTDRLQQAAPRSADPAELKRSLLATAELYSWALDRWAQRTGQPAPRCPIAPAVLRRLGLS